MYKLQTTLKLSEMDYRVSSVSLSRNLCYLNLSCELQPVELYLLNFGRYHVPYSGLFTNGGLPGASERASGQRRRSGAL